MYKVEVFREESSMDSKGKWTCDRVSYVKYDGCVQLRISEGGLISADFYDGSAKLYKLCDGEEVVKSPMTDEEIYAIPGLSEWYADAVVKAEAKKEAI